MTETFIGCEGQMYTGSQTNHHSRVFKIYEVAIDRLSTVSAFTWSEKIGSNTFYWWLLVWQGKHKNIFAGWVRKRLFVGFW